MGAEGVDEAVEFPRAQGFIYLNCIVLLVVTGIAAYAGIVLWPIMAGVISHPALSTDADLLSVLPFMMSVVIACTIPFQLALLRRVYARRRLPMVRLDPRGVTLYRGSPLLIAWPDIDRAQIDKGDSRRPDRLRIVLRNSPVAEWGRPGRAVATSWIAGDPRTVVAAINACIARQRTAPDE